MINPYADIDWDNTLYLCSVSHAHGRNNENLARLALGGVEHFPMSNYYPSSPVYPLTDYFTEVPNGAIGCPNAEHHNTNIGGYVHINGLGSTFSSGSEHGGEHYGYDGGRWQNLFRDIIDNLLYSDGGGVTINHPCWTHDNMNSFSVAHVKKMLDYDRERILGIEIYTDSTVSEVEAERQHAYALNMWDEILCTGRRCWGFGTPDWGAYANTDGTWRGRTILLVPEKTEHDVLVAYRKGAFFARINNTALAFTDISFDVDSYTIEASANGASSMAIIIDGNYTTHQGNAVSMSIPRNATYARIEAYSDNDKIFSNPIMLRGVRSKKSIVKSMLMM